MDVVLSSMQNREKCRCRRKSPRVPDGDQKDDEEHSEKWKARGHGRRKFGFQDFPGKQLEEL